MRKDKQIMPRRTRSHTLETESETAFRAALPTRMLYRPKDKDYGIDGEVEIFEESGNATGNIFLIQLKATDGSDLRKALRLRLRIETARYYASLELPLLLVRYHSPSKSIYTRWFHSLDLYYGKRTATGVSFKFDDDDKWSSGRSDAIEESVKAYRNTRRPTPSLPIVLSVVLTEDNFHGFPRFELVTRLESAARPLESTVRLEFSRTMSAARPDRILLAPHQIAVFIGDRPAMTIHAANEMARETTGASLASDIMMALGLAFDWVGHSAIGAEMIVANNVESKLTQYWPTAEVVARCLKRARRLSDSLAIARRLMLSADGPDVGYIYLLPVIYHLLVDQPKQYALIDGLIDLADELARIGHRIPAAALNYSCGNILRSACDFRRALKYYHKAVRLNQSYADRDYFEAELGGVLFLLNRFKQSAAHYGRALSLRNDREVQLRYADALMFSGSYRDALVHFTTALNDSSIYEDAEWLLKQHTLTQMLASGASDIQCRRRVTWDTEPFNPRSMNDEEIIRQCIHALSEDALSPLACYNLGGAAYRSNRLAIALGYFLRAALAVPEDNEAWCNAAACAIGIGDNQMAMLVLIAGYERNQETFVLKLYDRVQPDAREGFAELLTSLREVMPKSRKPAPILRILKPDNTWAEFRSAGKEES